MKRIALFIVCIFLLPAFFAEASTKEKNVQLIQAAERGKLTEVQNALNDGADVNAKNTFGLTALMMASYCGYTNGNYAEVVKLLLDKGADINVKNSKGETALVIAKDKGQKEIAGMLERTGAK
jgi:ankyrin repeat protein